MPQRLDPDVIQSLVTTIYENDDVIGTRYGWEGEYAITTITLRRHVGPPGDGTRPVGTGSGPALRSVDAAPTRKD